MKPTLRTARPVLVAVVAMTAVLAAGCGGGGQPQSAPTPSTGTSATSPGGGPAPTRTPDASPTPRHRLARSPFASMRRYVSLRSGQVTAALFDARTGKVWVLNPGSVQDTASIVKVEIMGTALAEAQASGRPLPAAEQALMPSMIEQSDNQSATTLLADVGGPKAVGRFDRSAGLTDTIPSTLAFIPGTSLPGWGLTTTTALDEVRLVSRFAYPNSILSSASRRYGLGLMEQVEAGQNWGVTAGVPAGTTVALKNGWVPIPPSNLWQINSIGWISGHGRDYVLAVLTKGNPSEGYGISTIQDIASTVYRELGTARYQTPQAG